MNTRKNIVLIIWVTFMLLSGCTDETPEGGQGQGTFHDIKISKPREGDKFTFGLPSVEVGDSDIEIAVEGAPAEGQQQYSSQMIWEITPQSGWTDVQGPTARLMRSNLYGLNSDFGDHTISVSYEDSTLITHTGSVEVQVFFKKYDETNPGNVDPNWYYYWSQTSATTGSHYYGGDNGNVDGEYFSGDNFFYIYDHASETSEVGGGYRSNRPAGIEVSGIDLFAVVCLHENLHQTHYFDWVATGLADSDGDWVPDAIEDSNGNGVWDWTDLNGDGTYNDGEGETRIDINDTDADGQDDEQELAWDIEYTWVIGNADSEDWSNPGKNIP